MDRGRFTDVSRKLLSIMQHSSRRIQFVVQRGQWNSAVHRIPYLGFCFGQIVLSLMPKNIVYIVVDKEN
jgi:hypothetical protein